MTVTVLPDIASAFILIFARIGTLVMLLPALGERMVPVRVRLSLALLMALIFYPFARPFYPDNLSDAPQMIMLLGGEVLVGVLLGITGRLLLSCLQTAGTVIAQVLGLGFVTQVDPSQGQQGALVGNFLTILGITLLFATDMHHMSIAALGDSYQIFRPGDLPDLGDSARYAVLVAAGAFKIGIQLAAPILVLGLIFNVGLGLLARLMPQMQVFFIAVPASIMLGFALMAVVLATMMGVFTDYIRDGLAELVMR
ncbi:flagellar biosynthetic protein FliR [Agaricicola taiwanensis]|uniref:Flagellar biosynthetic protein FliR n=1 Tax=Agaricicola taiwanensis TaxID=591372 RepID=A0A8J2VVE8_9RHOB|nr:flagellar biosynthetic protein FliR [Agaricicola taiwanensis]GGE40731.1 flagellar biosynthetic protein FliR [Agaricicola taiwanensis]